MFLQNASMSVTHFIIGGFDTVRRPLEIGVVILIIYIVSIIANMVNIVLIIFEQRLHKPMYLLICNLAVVDIVYTSSAGPTMIGVLIAGIKRISFVPCLIQMFVFHWAGVMEMFALALMAFDRLVAVSCPFQYHAYLTNGRTIVLTLMLWFAAACFVAVMPATVIPLPHCSLRLKYTYCDYAAVLRTTCANLNYYFKVITVLSFFLLFFTFVFIFLSYIGIIFVVKLSSNTEKMKIGSTCLSHLIVVTCYYGLLFVRIILTRAGLVLTIEEWNGIMLGVTLGPSLVNPFVYCLRTKEIRQTLLKMFKHMDSSH